MRRLLLTSAACLLCHGTFADMLGPSPVILNRAVVTAPVAGGAYVGPLDAVSGAIACNSLQACSAAIATAGTQKMFNVTRASDSHSCDILPATNGGPGNTANCSTGGDNGQSASSFLGASTFIITDLWDQTGNSHDCTETSNKPALILSGGPSSGQPAIVFTGTQDLQCSLTGTGSPFTVSAVAVRTGAFTTLSSVFYKASDNFLQLSYSATPNNMLMYGNGGGTNIPGVTDNAWHTLQAVFNAGSSSLKIDSASPVATTIGSQGITTTVFLGGGSGGQPLTGQISEFIVYGSALSTGNQTALSANQHTRWGF